MSLYFQKKVLKKHFGGSNIDKWLNESRKVYKELVTKLPNIGGRGNRMLSFLKTSLILMPVVAVLKREGLPVRKIGEVIYDLASIAYHKIPLFIRKASASSFFSTRKARKWRKIAARSQLRGFSGDWVVTTIQADSLFHHGYDITECAILKFWRAQGLEEFVPYMCLTDWAKWHAFGINARRTQTLANGHEKCDFRFIRTGSVESCGWPPESMPEWSGRFEVKPV
jgi:hypothetical protein